ncbi:MarR family winged helix-turn-helix transcriptional regulator [Bradyrhizobium huanghuaihaiense]|uniref:MarR family winged helix-turn-helix transcriptional regulator n=1 Tax=Bradyrhizobium huanghuaihaiense TaxID=990078 RepID=UPI0021AAB04B|nr:MarR family winged helix-turn-helix transcriptional regulator [Bradyrhizobium sp. CB3035]UWU78151.1 MarR family winged helix-turn-helix transcriptional regulator [Bradyrhizobium sp. CB3035]
MSDDDSQGLSPQARWAARTLLNVLLPMRRTRKRLTFSLVNTFLNVAAQEGLTVSELAARCGVSGEVMSKHLRDLGAVNRRHGTGLGLVAVVQQIHGDRRERHVVITPQGLDLVRQMMAVLKGETPPGTRIRKSLPTEAGTYIPAETEGVPSDT